MPFGKDGQRSRWQRLRGEFSAFGDTDFAIGAGLIVAILGITGIASEKLTLSLTLLVLAALAASLHRDRALRENLDRSVNDLESRLSVVSRALSNPLPYDVIAARYRWDFDQAGDIAYVSKQARVRFVHNGVWTLLCWHTDIGNVHKAEARRLLGDTSLPLGVLGNLDMGDGKFAKLIALDRKYGQNQVLDFEYRFQSRDNFPDTHEWLDITIETFTADLEIEIVWPPSRTPTEVFLDEEGERHSLEMLDSAGRRATTIKRQNLVAGQRIAVRWSWQSTKQLREAVN